MQVQDMASQLERSRVAETQDMASHQATNLLRLQFRTKKRDPHTLHIPQSNPLTTELLKLAHPTTTIASPALFTPQAHRLQALVMSHVCAFDLVCKQKVKREINDSQDGKSRCIVNKLLKHF
jgi:hypothetical protein